VIDQKSLVIEFNWNRPSDFLRAPQIGEAEKIDKKEINQIVRREALACLCRHGREQEVLFRLRLPVRGAYPPKSL
jgi:hypothetical protein